MPTPPDEHSESNSAVVQPFELSVPLRPFWRHDDFFGDTTSRRRLVDSHRPSRTGPMGRFHGRMMFVVMILAHSSLLVEHRGQPPVGWQLGRYAAWDSAHCPGDHLRERPLCGVLVCVCTKTPLLRLDKEERNLARTHLVTVLIPAYVVNIAAVHISVTLTGMYPCTQQWYWFFTHPSAGRGLL